MSQTQVNIGQAPDDGNGDTLRAAFAKVNSNATDAQARLSAAESVISQGFTDVSFLSDDDAGTYVLTSEDGKASIGLMIVENVVDTSKEDVLVKFKIASVSGTNGAKLRLVVVLNPSSENLIAGQSELVTVPDIAFKNAEGEIAVLRPQGLSGSVEYSLRAEVTTGTVTINSSGVSNMQILKFKDVGGV